MTALATLPAEKSFNNKLSSGIIFTIGIVGMIVNLHVILALRRAQSFGYTFGRICMSQSVANFGNALVYAIFVVPITLINPDFHKHYVGVRAGQLLILFWNASVISHFFTALNRCVVMYFPLTNTKIFTKRVADSVVTFTWLFSIAQVLPYFSTECLFDYHIESFNFQFGDSPCSVVVGTFTDYYFSIAMLSCISALDFATFLRIRYLHKMTVALPMVAQLRRGKEIRFFLQAVCQGLAFMGDLFNFFCISQQFENKWFRFAFTTCSWMSVHMIDGLIVIAFNKEIRAFRLGSNCQNVAMRTTN